MAIKNNYSSAYNFSNKTTYTPTAADNKFFTEATPNRNRSINNINANNPSFIRNEYRDLYGNLFGADSQFSNAEQVVLANMTSETISVNGITLRYMTRRAPPGVGVDNVFNEVPESQFDTGFSIDCWIQNIEGFEGATVIRYYGLEIQEEVDIVISVARFNELVRPYDSEVYFRGDSEYVRSRPLEGDIILIPFGISSVGEFQYVADVMNRKIKVAETPQYFPKMFEVLRVSTWQDGPFFQLGTNQTYKLHCRLFELSGETINFDSEFADYSPNTPDAADSTIQYILDTLRAYDSEGEVPGYNYPIDSDINNSGILDGIDVVNKLWGDRFGENQAIEQSAQEQNIYSNEVVETRGKYVTHTYVSRQSPKLVGDYGQRLYNVPGIINYVTDSEAYRR